MWKHGALMKKEMVQSNSVFLHRWGYFRNPMAPSFGCLHFVVLCRPEGENNKSFVIRAFVLHFVKPILYWRQDQEVCGVGLADDRPFL